MKAKKAFEIQFNWIFVLIAGAAILIFFTSIIIKQKSITQSSTNIEVLKQIESIISGASASTDTIVPLDMPDFEIKISCNKVSIGSSASQYQNLILFSPSLIKGSRVITQTLAFSEPYKSSNLLFVTSTRVKYVLIGGDLMKEINKTLPAESGKEAYALYEPSKILNANNYNVKLVFFNTNFPSSVPSSFEKMPDSDVSAIKITGNAEKGEIGEIEFYEKKKEQFSLAGKSAYIGKSSLIAAIYAGTIGLYECGMKNALSRHSLVAQVHKGKTEQLEKDAKRAECKNIYTNSIKIIDSLGKTSSKIAESQKIAINDISSLSADAKSLAIQNKELQKFSCPLIY
ncbi:hypothetical protein HY637_03195 [Candidatus Woesearchaeota archaeon]|nr:hypothetical protein [Candidatus Woesearchaeota archaeon]